jgi:hypothetical protein
MPVDCTLGHSQQGRQGVPKWHDLPHHASDGACGWQVDRIWKRVQSRMNKRSDGHFTSNHQSSDKYGNNI